MIQGFVLDQAFLEESLSEDKDEGTLIGLLRPESEIVVPDNCLWYVPESTTVKRTCNCMVSSTISLRRSRSCHVCVAE